MAGAIAAAVGCGGGGGGEAATGAGGDGAVSSANTSGSMASSSSAATTGSMAASTGSVAASTGSMTGAGGGSTGSMAGSGGATTTGSMSGSGGSSGCPTPTMATVATHITMNVTWPGSIAIEAGSGVVHIWTLSMQTFNGNMITGTGRPCGSIIPDLKATFFAGGMLIGNTIPDATWETPSIPVSMITGTHTGFDVGSTVSINKNATVIGATMPNPLTDPWPMSYTGLMAVDHDSDTKPGITATPKSGPGYQLPPTSLGGPPADRLYLATRTVLSLSGTRDTCDTVTGTAVVEKFDNHVVGCRIQNAGDCQAAETGFIDGNRTIFMIGTATYKAKTLSAGATCADARAALP